MGETILGQPSVSCGFSRRLSQLANAPPSPPKPQSRSEWPEPGSAGDTGASKLLLPPLSFAFRFSFGVLYSSGIIVFSSLRAGCFLSADSAFSLFCSFSFHFLLHWLMQKDKKTNKMQPLSAKS